MSASEKKLNSIFLYTDISCFSNILLNENPKHVCNYTKSRVYLHILFYFLTKMDKNTNKLTFLLTIIK